MLRGIVIKELDLEKLLDDAERDAISAGRILDCYENNEVDIDVDVLRMFITKRLMTEIFLLTVIEELRERLKHDEKD